MSDGQYRGAIQLRESGCQSSIVRRGVSFLYYPLSLACMIFSAQAASSAEALKLNGIVVAETQTKGIYKKPDIKFDINESSKPDLLVIDISTSKKNLDTSSWLPAKVIVVSLKSIIDPVVQIHSADSQQRKKNPRSNSLSVSTMRNDTYFTSQNKLLLQAPASLNERLQGVICV